MALPRSSSLLTKTVLAVVSTLIAVVAAEALARLIGSGPTFGQRIFVREVPTRTVDGVALWSDEHPRTDAEDLRRAAADRAAFTILGLGDSIMYGVRVAKQDTYLEQTRRALEGRAKQRIEILNLAVPGFNTMQENAVHKEIEDRVQPNLVLVHYFGGDDAHQYRVVGGYVVDFGNVSDDGRLVVRALPLPPRVSDFLLVHSRLYDLLTQLVMSRRLPEPTDWTRVSGPLSAIDDRAKRAGGRLLVLASPDLGGVAPQPIVDLPLLRQFAATRGIEVIDLREWLAGVDVRQIALDSCHFNAEGHRLIGERLAEYLLERDLKP